MKLNAQEIEPEEVGLMRVFKVPSETDAAVTHYYGQALGIGMDQPTDYFCSCQGFRFRQTCKHVDSLKGQTNETKG